MQRPTTAHWATLALSTVQHWMLLTYQSCRLAASHMHFAVAASPANDSIMPTITHILLSSLLLQINDYAMGLKIKPSTALNNEKNI